MGPEADAARKRAGIVVAEATGVGFAPRSGQMGVIHRDGGRLSFNRAVRLDMIGAGDLPNGKSRLSASKSHQSELIRPVESRLMAAWRTLEKVGNSARMT